MHLNVLDRVLPICIAHKLYSILIHHNQSCQILSQGRIALYNSYEERAWPHHSNQPIYLEIYDHVRCPFVSTWNNRTLNHYYDYLFIWSSIFTVMSSNISHRAVYLAYSDKPLYKQSSDTAKFNRRTKYMHTINRETWLLLLQWLSQ